MNTHQCQVGPIPGKPDRVGCGVCGMSWDASLGVTGCIDGTGKLVSDHAAEPIMQFFAYSHLPPHLQKVSEPFCDIAAQIIVSLPRNPERTVALRKLLEAKDAAVRAKLYK